MPLFVLLLACPPRPVPVDSTPDPVQETGAPDTQRDTHDTADAPEPFVLEWALTRPLDGFLQLTSNLPSDPAACALLHQAPCSDADSDGLVDAWEDLVLEQLRPIVVLDEDEPGVTDPELVLAAIGRVALAQDGHVRVFMMLGWSRDYGRCGISAHDGDSERVALDLLLDGDTATVVGAYTAAHEGEITDAGRLFQGAELSELETTDAPAWRIYASEGKHATYATAKICEDVSVVPCLDEDCSPDGVSDPADYERRPAAWNAGEPDAPRLTDLTVAGFPDEDAWADQTFCGGRGRGDGCSSPVHEKLLVDPFVGR